MDKNDLAEHKVVHPYSSFSEDVKDAMGWNIMDKIMLTVVKGDIKCMMCEKNFIWGKEWEHAFQGVFNKNGEQLPICRKCSLSITVGIYTIALL